MTEITALEIQKEKAVAANEVAIVHCDLCNRFINRECWVIVIVFVLVFRSFLVMWV